VREDIKKVPEMVTSKLIKIFNVSNLVMHKCLKKIYDTVKEDIPDNLADFTEEHRILASYLKDSEKNL